MEPVDLAYDVLGEAHHPPLIILHGFLASARNWRQVADKLAARYRVYVLDLRNHGVSPHHPVLDYPSMATDLLNFVDRQGLATVNLLGHSMGGKVAMWFALQHPQRVAKLLVADIAPVSYRHSFDGIIDSLRSLPLDQLQTRRHADELLASAIPEVSHRQFLLQNLVLKDGAYRWRVNLEIFRAAAPHIVAFPDTTALKPFEGRTCAIVGADSDYARAENFQDLFPAFSFAVIPEAAHWLHVQQPAAFLERVESFLQGH